MLASLHLETAGDGEAAAHQIPSHCEAEHDFLTPSFLVWGNYNSQRWLYSDKQGASLVL